MVDSILEYIWEGYREWLDGFVPRQRRRGLLVGLFLGAVFVAGFLAWSEEHEKVISAFQPKFLVDGYSLFFTERKDITPPPSVSGVFVLALASVRNLGSPSIAEGWELQADLPSGQSLKADVGALSSLNTAAIRITTIDNKTIRIDKRADLVEKAVITPVPTGGKVAGAVLFVFEGYVRSMIEQPGIKFTLSCRDVSGKVYSSSTVWSGKTGEIRHVPGVEME